MDKIIKLIILFSFILIGLIWLLGHAIIFTINLFGYEFIGSSFHNDFFIGIIFIIFFIIISSLNSGDIDE